LLLWIVGLFSKIVEGHSNYVIYKNVTRKAQRLGLLTISYGPVRKCSCLWELLSLLSFHLYYRLHASCWKV